MSAGAIVGTCQLRERTGFVSESVARLLLTCVMSSVLLLAAAAASMPSSPACLGLTGLCRHGQSR
eukprot:2297173-Rhodomonas_salina.2